ncbi:UNVERIFIED_CONTAM: hypothetical protein PYX00_001677 [Menopon gallinae]|uniref:Aquaporin n=1 Tax=Menopon gallinae TaxID=328185 RepID=A0AAW2IE06_9NEOP
MNIETKYFTISVAAIFAEFGGTAVLLFVGCLGCLGSVPYQASVSFGMGLITAIQIFGHISGGHFNPAVTLSAVIFNMLSVPVAIIYVLAQLVGAIAGHSLAMFLAPLEHNTRSQGSTFCNTVPQVDDLEAFVAEFFATLLLVLFCCSVWDSRSEGKRDSVPLKLGMYIFAIVQLVGPMTGASLNPARTFGPSIINNNWELHWMYWVAPMLSAVVGTVAYRYLFLEGRTRRN